MQSASPGSRDVGYFPSVYSSLSQFAVPDMSFSKGQTNGSFHLPGSSMTNSSWERRCLRKHRRRTDDDGCSVKRQKMMDGSESHPSEDMSSRPGTQWMAERATGSPTVQHGAASVPSCPNTRYTQSTVPATRVEAEASCMEVEAAQRKLQEIENRITLEDDSDEDLDVEPPQRRPVLVLSDSLREGLQRGIADILPHTVAQSVSHSCMELVLWRPPEDPLTQQLRDSLQKQQRKQQPVCRQTPTPIPVSLAKGPDQHTPPASTSTTGSTEEDMEL